MKKDNQNIQIKLDFTNAKSEVKVISINRNIDRKLSDQILKMKRPISR